jgi:GNAT superfamily N-acetyltransferase
MTTTEQIIRATAADVRPLAKLIATAFAPMRACEWLVNDPHDRVPILAAQFEIVLNHATVWGQVDTTTDRTAVAVWFPRTTQAAPPPTGYDQRLADACGPYVNNFRHLDELFDRHHPTLPHHHLALLAVAPERQGTGLGSALLHRHHQLLDQHDFPAYLEASNRRNRALYLRHGYQDRGRSFTLPNGARFWPMWRAPQAAQT